MVGLDHPISLVWHLPVLVSGASASGRRKSRRPAAHRSTAARLRGALGDSRGVDHLQTVLGFRSAIVFMPDFNVRSDSINVEQIMEQIRARIREKRGVDYTEQEIRELE